MRLLLWGISNVGKTTIGKELSKMMNCRFYDIDDVIIDEYGSIDKFQELFPDDDERFEEKMEMMLNIIDSDTNDFIMAVSPIFSPAVVERILETNTSSIEIVDTPEAIYDRLIIEGEDYLEYKEENKEYYMWEIKWDQTASYKEFKNIPKVHIDNQSIEEAVKTVYNYLLENKNTA